MIVTFIVLLILLLFLFVYYILSKNHDYWKERNVPYVKPKLFFGNYSRYILLKQYAPEITRNICKQFPNEPYIGTFFGTEPALIVQDPELIKLVMTKDFIFFNGREVTKYAHREIITRSVSLTGGDEWKVLRTNMTPLFTSSKLRNMFPLIRNYAKEFEEYLGEETKISHSVNARSILARYTMDCVISCAYGVNANTMHKDNGDNPFVIMADRLFDASWIRGLKMVCRSMWPSIFYGLGFKFFDDQVCLFFSKLFAEACEKRIKDGIIRNDFIDLIVEWKKKSHLSSEGLYDPKTGKKTIHEIPVKDDLLVGQTLAIFGAGFETTATATTYLLYELAKHTKIQEQVIEEIDAYFNKNHNIEYDCINQLPFLEACIDETLRLYPVLGVITREVMDEYVLPSGLLLQKDLRIHIPVYYLHKNAKYFPEPDRFRPKRFLGAEKEKINPFTYIPFGAGPRICLGKYKKIVKIIQIYSEPYFRDIVMLDGGTQYSLSCHQNEEIKIIYPSNRNRSHNHCASDVVGLIHDDGPNTIVKI